MQLRRMRQKANSLCVGESLQEGNPSQPPRVATELGNTPRGKSPDWVAKTTNSKPFVIFPAEILLHKVYISNILCGLRL